MGRVTIFLLLTDRELPSCRNNTIWSALGTWVLVNEPQKLHFQKVVDGLKERRDEFAEVKKSYEKLCTECDHFGLKVSHA